jgi:hypothetical protein
LFESLFRVLHKTIVKKHLLWVLYKTIVINGFFEKYSKGHTNLSGFSLPLLFMICKENMLTADCSVVRWERAVVLKAWVCKELAVQLGERDLELVLEGADVGPAEPAS